LAGRARPARAGALSRTIFAFAAGFFAAFRGGAFAAALRGALQSFWLAIRAPATRASSFAHMMLGWTRRMNGPWAKPQSVLASTFSRPTHSA
jgi:hypothetical protein